MPRRPSPAMVVAGLALFVAIAGGSAIALEGHNSVHSDDIRDGEVQPRDLEAARLERVEDNPGLSGEREPCELGRTGVFCGIEKESFSRYDGWENYGNDYRPATYYRDGYDTVHLGGTVSLVGAPSPAESVFVLPPAYRPAGISTFSVPCRLGELNPPQSCSVEVRRNGRVVSLASYDDASDAGLSLDGISFRAQ